MLLWNNLPIRNLSEVNEENLTEEIKDTIGRGAEFLLMHRLFKADHHGYKVVNQFWLRLSFPWFYRYNRPELETSPAHSLFSVLEYYVYDKGSLEST